MKPVYLIAAGLLAFLYWRHHNGADVAGATRVEEAEAAHNEGTDFLPDLWGMLGGQGVNSANFPNALPGANANPGGQASAQLGLNPAWDGSLK